MNKILMFSMCLASIICAFFIIHQMPYKSNQEDLKLIVENFCDAVSRNDRKSLANYITEFPPSYKDVYIEYGKKHMGDNFVRYGKVVGENSGSPKIFKELSDFSNQDEMINYIIPPLNLITEQNRKLTKIIEVKQNENQARVTVNFGNEKYADISFEILLFNDGKNWRIFKFDYPDPFSAKYGVDDKF